jgi:triosephosphate isomerase (TIM)
MRLKIIAANWKMHTTLQESTQLVENVLEQTGKVAAGRLLILSPPFPFLKNVFDLVKQKENVAVAAQNCHHENKGAFTGEVSPAMLQSVGCRYVIIGHSERRILFNETEEIIFKKMYAAILEGLKVIYCCGEPIEIREAEKHKEYVSEQLNGSILRLPADMIDNAVIAYEPVWAIGTGKTATSAQAQEMHAFIRNTVKNKFGKEVASNISILYGGSVKAANAREIFSQHDVDGGLVGGASLNAEEFAAIVNSI